MQMSYAGTLKGPDNARLTFLAYLLFGLLALATLSFIFLSVKNVRIEVGGRSISLLTLAPDVGEALKEAGVSGPMAISKSPASLNVGESLTYLTLTEDPKASVRDGMTIKVFTNLISKTVENEIIPAPVNREWDIFMVPGQERVVAAGKSGMRENTYLTSYRDGELVSKERLGTNVINKPIARHIKTGSYEEVSRGLPAKSGRACRFVATAYSYTGHRTAVGAGTRRGIVAVDPRVIPLGTRIFIDGYGFGVAADTGGAIKGRKIDLFMESEQEARKWGRRTVAVYIMPKN